MIEVLKFSASWCGPCKALSSILKDVENIKEIDVDENRDLAIENNVRNVPTLVFLKDGKEVKRSTGMISLTEYNNIINELNN